MNRNTVEISTGKTQNEEPYVSLHFGPEVTEGAQSEAKMMCCGYGLACGYGPGPRRDAEAAARKLSQRLRRLGWSVAVEVTP